MLCFTLFISCKTRDSLDDCSKFHKGLFYIKSDKDSSYTLLERNDSIQTVSNTKLSLKQSGKVVWRNSCEYEFYNLTQIEDTVVLQLQPSIIRTRIIESGNNYYIFEAKMQGIDKITRDTAWVNDGYLH